MFDPLLKLGRDLSEKVILEERKKKKRLEEIKMHAIELGEKTEAYMNIKNMTS